MRVSTIVLALIFMTTIPLSYANNSTRSLRFQPIPIQDNTTVRYYTNETKNIRRIVQTERILNFPTQVIRLMSGLEGWQLTCEQVQNEIERTLLVHINRDRFIFNTIVYCTYDPSTYLATQFSISSFFDPINEQAIEFLRAFKSELRSLDFFGQKLEVESAKAVIVVLNIAVGTKRHFHRVFTQLRQDRANFNFINNLTMRTALFTDVDNNFFNNDPERILQFINTWFFSFADRFYRTVLRESNYIELQIDRIFIMERREKIFVSDFKIYFAIHCNEFGRQRCM